MTVLPDLPTDIHARASKVQCVVLDIDGVMTDGKLYLGAAGAEWKAVNVRDGLGIKLLLRAGIEVAVISGRPSPAMETRLSDLGVAHIWLDAENKMPAFDALLNRLGIGDTQCAVMGDDVPDLPLMQRAGLSMTVANAHPSVLACAHWCSRYSGGAGAIREAADLLITVQELG